MITVNGLTLKQALTDGQLQAITQIPGTVKDIIDFYYAQSKQQDTISTNPKITPNLDWKLWCLFKSGSKKTLKLYYSLRIQENIDKVIEAIQQQNQTAYPAFNYPLQTAEHIKSICTNLYSALFWYLQYCVGRYEDYKKKSKDDEKKQFSANNKYAQLQAHFRTNKNEIIERLTKYYTDNFKYPEFASIPETTQQLEILNKLKDKGYLIDRYDEESNTHTLTTPDGTPVDASVIKSIAKDVAKADIYRQAANRKGMDFRQSRATADNLISGDFGLTGREINNTHNDVSTDSLKSSLERRKPIKIKHDLHFNPELLKRNFH